MCPWNAPNRYGGELRSKPRGGLTAQEARSNEIGIRMAGRAWLVASLGLCFTVTLGCVFSPAI